jgi:phosphohistidine phosphatase SixA
MNIRFCTLALLIIFVSPQSYAQEAIFLIRHAEQMIDVEDPPLTEVGQKRAMAWAEILEKSGIKAVYTSKKRRTKQTGELIAQALEIPLESVPRKEVTQLVEKIRSQNAGERILIVTHSRQMPKIFKELGLSEEVIKKTTFTKAEYGNLFIFVPEGEDGGMVLQLRY